MPPQTIFGCFNHRLPDFNYPEWAYHVSHTSSTTVGDFDPPHMLVHQKPRDWVAIGEGYLGTSGLASSLGSYYVPKTEVPFTLSTEEDVVRANALYLCHPVKLALEKLCRQPIFQTSEVYSPLEHSRLRADIAWYFGQMDSPTYFAVLEIKSPGTLDEDEFKQGGISGRRSNESMEEYTNRYYRKLENAQSSDSGTLLRDNSKLVTRQAGAYAYNFSTSFVACLDWQSLILFEFQSFSASGCGESATDSYITDGNHAYMRKALLGFLCNAYKQAGGDFK